MDEQEALLELDDDGAFGELNMTDEDEEDEEGVVGIVVLLSLCLLDIVAIEGLL